MDDQDSESKLSSDIVTLRHKVFKWRQADDSWVNWTGMPKKSKQKEVSWATNTYMITETWKWMNAQIKSAQTAHKKG